MDAWKDKRKAWTTLRDKHKIKKGAVSGVSLGDAIDKVYAAACKGYKPLLKATAGLKKAVTAYNAKLKHAELAKWLKTNLTDPLTAIEQDAAADIKALEEYLAFMLNFNQVAVPGFPMASDMAKTLQVIGHEKLSFPDGVKKQNVFAHMPRVLAEWTEAANQVRNFKIKLPLPGLGPHAAVLNSRLELLTQGWQLRDRFHKLTETDDYFVLLKQVSGNSVDVEQHYKTQEKAVKALLG